MCAHRFAVNPAADFSRLLSPRTPHITLPDRRCHIFPAKTHENLQSRSFRQLANAVPATAQTFKKQYITIATVILRLKCGQLIRSLMLGICDNQGADCWKTMTSSQLSSVKPDRLLAFCDNACRAGFLWQSACDCCKSVTVCLGCPSFRPWSQGCSR